MLLVDTDVLVDVLRGHRPAVEWFEGLDELPSVPGLVDMELVQDADSKERMDRALKLVAPPTTAAEPARLPDLQLMQPY